VLLLLCKAALQSSATKQQQDTHTQQRYKAALLNTPGGMLCAVLHPPGLPNMAGARGGGVL